MPRTTVLALALVLTGCYQAIFVPDTPHIPRVEPTPGEQIDATDEVKDLGTFHWTRRNELVRDTRREATATYAGRQLTYTELSALADPDWDRRIAELGEMRSTCKRAVIPQVVGVLAFVGGIAAIAATHQSDTPVTDREQNFVSGAITAGMASYAIGYLIGGRKCNELYSVRSSLHINDSSTSFYNREAEWVSELARNFTRRRRSARARAPESEVVTVLAP